MAHAMLPLRRPPGDPYVIGHRGAMGHAPENTLAAFRRGADLGADLLECDVQRSRDGHLVVIHDHDLERTTGGRGWVRDHDLADLRALDAGGGERIPTLDEILDLVAERPGLGIVVEIKNGPVFYPGIEDQVAAALVRHGLVERAIGISFDHVAVRALKERLPALATGILYDARLAAPVEAARAALADTIWPAVAMLAPEVCPLAHDAGLGVFAWTANDPASFSRVLEAGADGFGTDFPDRGRAAKNYPQNSSLTRFDTHEGG